MLRAHEDEREAALGVQLLDEAVELALEGDRHERVLDRRPACGRSAARRGSARRSTCSARASSATPPSSVAEKSIVWRFVGHRAQDAVDLRLEAHVEHPVGLVEHERPHAVELDQALLEQVVEAAGRRDEHVRAAGLLRLRAERTRRRRRSRRAGSSSRRAARRSSATCVASSRVGTSTSAAGCEPVPAVRSTSGRPNASVLPEPVGRLGEDVEAAEGVREHELLDRERLVDVACGKRTHNGCAHAERLERLGHAVRLLVQAGFEMQRLESPEKEEREARSHEHRTALSSGTVARTRVRAALRPGPGTRMAGSESAGRRHIDG